MKITPDDIELIEKSIEGSLNSDEAVEFEKKFKNSDTFRESVQFQRSLLSSLDANHKVKLKEELRGMLQNANPQKKASPISNRWYMLAASVVLLAGLVWTFGLSNSSHEKLFDKYYEPYPAQGMIRGDVSTTESEELFKQYSAGNYEKVIGIINSQLQNGASFDGQTIYLANAYLSLNQIDNAIDILQSIDPGNRYYFDGQWFMALALIEKGKTEEASDILKILSTQNTVYTSSVLAILNDLE